MMTSLKFIVVVLLLYGFSCLPLFHERSFSSAREKLSHVGVTVAMESLGGAIGETTPLSGGLIHEGSVETIGGLAEDGMLLLLLVGLSTSLHHSLNCMPAYSWSTLISACCFLMVGSGIPYRRKYWRDLNLAVEPKIAISRILADVNLAVRYGIAIRIYASRKFWRILIWRLQYRPPNRQI